MGSADRVVEIDMTSSKYEFYDANGLIYDCSNKENLFTKMCMIADYYNNELKVGVTFAVR